MATKKTESSTTKSGSSVSMAELLQKVKSSIVTPQKGSIIKGRITKLTPQEILVDINAKTEAVVLEKDRRLLRNLLSRLSVGDTVDVQVLNPESDLGNPVVSLRRFLDDLTWEKLAGVQKNRESVSVTITELTRGGYIVTTTEGTTGFLPNSYVSFTPQTAGGTQESNDLIGKTIKAYVLELNRPLRKIIFSQKPTLDVKDFEEAVKGIKKDQIIEGTVTNCASFGVFVAVPLQNDAFIDGLVHISEVSWNESSNLQDMFHAGQKVTCKVINIDKDAKRIELSIKRLTDDPFVKLTQSLSVDQKVTGVVKRVAASGLYVALDILSEQNDTTTEAVLRKEKIPPNTVFEVGSKITATISQIDAKRHRISLVPVLTEKPIGYR